MALMSRTTADNPPTDWMLYLRHSGQMGTSYINAWLNPGLGTRLNGLLGLNTNWNPRTACPELSALRVGGRRSRFNAPGWGSALVCLSRCSRCPTRTSTLIC